MSSLVLFGGKCSIPCRASVVAQTPEYVCDVPIRFNSKGLILTSVGAIVEEVASQAISYHHSVRCGYCGEPIEVKK